MAAFDPQAYGPVFAPILETDRRRRLDAGRRDAGGAALLKQLSVDTAFAHAQSEFGKAQRADAEMAECCVAGVWLLHDCLHESHSISQEIHTPSGSFWHAILHRREGDFSNAKYWFRRAGRHPAYEAIGQQAHVAASLRSKIRRGKDASSSLGETRLRDGTWDPFGFVDLCQAAVSGQPDVRELCLDIQQAEWEPLFDHCYCAAVNR